MEYFAAVDLGSHTCRSLIANIHEDGYQIVDSFSKVVRLGGGVRSSGIISKTAMDRTILALKESARRLEKYDIAQIRCVTTEACRLAKNKDVLLAQVEMETGLKLEVIPEHEEARLALQGCMGLVDPRIPYVLAFDIGGCSTEIIWAKLENDCSTTVIDWCSLPFGVVGIYESCRGDTANFYADISERINKEVGKLLIKNDIVSMIEDKKVQVIGNSGTTTTVAAISLGLPSYDRSVVDGSYLSDTAVFETGKQLRNMSARERASHPCIGLARCDLVLGGVAILEGICKAGSIKSLRVADRGLRDGMIVDMMSRHHMLTGSTNKSTAA